MLFQLFNMFKGHQNYLKMDSTKLYALTDVINKWKNWIFRKLKAKIQKSNSLDKYRSELTTQTKKNHLNYMDEPTFKNINRKFILSFKAGINDLLKD